MLAIDYCETLNCQPDLPNADISTNALNILKS